MTRTLYQRLLEWWAVIGLYVIELLSGIAFAYTGNSVLFTKLAQETGYTGWHILFSVACITGALAVILLLFPFIQHKRNLWKRTHYILCSLPFAFYTTALGWYLLRTNGNPISALIFISIYIQFWIIAGAVWRPKEFS